MSINDFHQFLINIKFLELELDSLKIKYDTFLRVIVNNAQIIKILTFLDNSTK